MKSVLGMLKGRLRGRDKLETLENWSILIILLGGFLLSTGIASSIITTKGIPTVLAMSGSFISFVGIISLVLVWLIQELR